jgi:hypothetical protein
MKVISRRKILKDNLILGIKRYLTLNLVFFLLMVLTRTFEYFYLMPTITLPFGSLMLELAGIGHDVLMLLNLGAWFFFPFMVIHLISKHLANIVLGFLIIFFVLGEIALIQYFGTTSLLLGTDLFGYTFDEVIKIVSASGGFSVLSLFSIVVCITMIFFLMMFSRRINVHGFIALLFIVICFISLIFPKYTRPEPGKYNSELAYNLVANKAFHLFSSVHSFYYPDEATETSRGH